MSESISTSLSNERGGGYSARVELTLIVGTTRHRLAQVGSDRIYFRSPVALAAGAAELIVSVDGDATHTNVLILRGQGTSRIFEYSVA